MTIEYCVRLQSPAGVNTIHRQKICTARKGCNDVWLFSQYHRILSHVGSSWSAHRRGGGTTHVVSEPLDFIAQPSALVPQPRVNLTRLHGALAPNSKYRTRVTPAKRGRGGQHATTADPEERTPAERRAAKGCPRDWVRKSRFGAHALTLSYLRLWRVAWAVTALGHKPIQPAPPRRSGRPRSPPLRYSQIPL